MAGDDDIARLLPEPPPPRAARREAAIEAAMRRFDGEAPAPAAGPVRAPAWGRIGRPQMAAFASIALVAVVGVPLSLNVLRQDQAVHPHPGATPVALVPTPVASPAPGGTVLQAKQVAALPTAPAHDSTPIAQPRRAEPGDEPQACGKGNCEYPEEAKVAQYAPVMPAPAPMPEPLPPASADMASQEGMRSGRAAMPSEMAAKSSAGYESPGSIVVTGSRIRQANISNVPTAPPPQRRAAWNACTVNDPGRSLDGCGALINPTAKGDKGRAAASVSDGLTKAWRGDFEGAVNAFSTAITIQPRLAIAYVNRGLVYDRRGETGRALADLDKAVRYAPHAARGYAVRSKLRAQAGDDDGAQADAERAAELDPTYRGEE